MNITSILQQQIPSFTGKAGTLQLQPVGGGSINETFRIQSGDAFFFCKVNSATKFPHLFQKESNGLSLIQSHHKIKTPAVLNCFEAEGHQFLLLEWIEQGERTTGFWKKFGEQLAAMHQVKSTACGLDEDNYMGSVPQQNCKQEDWCIFFVEERLSPLIKNCDMANLLSRTDRSQFEKLTQKLPGIFEAEKPSLLHGDLWSGNFLCDSSSEPVLIDPAVYYGHRSMDLAMTTLFGGFRQPFYEA